VPTLKDKKAQIQRLLEIGQDGFGSKFGWKSKFARSLGMTPQQLNDYLSGRISIGAEMQSRLRGIDADVEYVMTGKKKVIPKGQVEFTEVELAQIPVFEYARAGSKSMVLAEKPSYHIASTRSKDDSRFAVVAKGKSMEPEIRDGELVVVSKKKEMKNGDVCLVMFEDGDACLRKVYCHDHGVTLTSANEKEYPPTLHKKSEIRSIYRMVQKITNY
jgi:SOS-response transcriptional repressor LexA